MGASLQVFVSVPPVLLIARNTVNELVEIDRCSRYGALKRLKDSVQRRLVRVQGRRRPVESKDAVAFPLRIEYSSRTVHDDERRGFEREAGELTKLFSRRTM